jgi:hypothetical protein
MAGLHTALCLAERMHNPHSQEACPPKDNNRWRMSRNNILSQKQQEAIESQIIVLEASEIGNGASGRAKGKMRIDERIDICLLSKSSSLTSFISR